MVPQTHSSILFLPPPLPHLRVDSSRLGQRTSLPFSLAPTTLTPASAAARRELSPPRARALEASSLVGGTSPLRTRALEAPTPAVEPATSSAPLPSVLLTPIDPASSTSKASTPVAATTFAPRVAARSRPPLPSSLSWHPLGLGLAQPTGRGMLFGPAHSTVDGPKARPVARRGTVQEARRAMLARRPSGHAWHGVARWTSIPQGPNP
jgi:hypothetical protein